MPLTSAEAVAFGSHLDVEAVIGRGVDLEERDYWEKTAWLIALQIGDISQAKLLLARGTDSIEDEFTFSQTRATPSINR